MSKPTVYGFCDAGCKWPVSHLGENLPVFTGTGSGATIFTRMIATAIKQNKVNKIKQFVYNDVNGAHWLVTTYNPAGNTYIVYGIGMVTSSNDMRTLYYQHIVNNPTTITENDIATSDYSIKWFKPTSMDNAKYTLGLIDYTYSGATSFEKDYANLIYYAIPSFLGKGNNTYIFRMNSGRSYLVTIYSSQSTSGPWSFKLKAIPLNEEVTKTIYYTAAGSNSNNIPTKLDDITPDSYKIDYLTNNIDIPYKAATKDELGNDTYIYYNIDTAGLYSLSIVDTTKISSGAIYVDGKSSVEVYQRKTGLIEIKDLDTIQSFKIPDSVIEYMYLPNGGYVNYNGSQVNYPAHSLVLVTSNATDYVWVSGKLTLISKY